jgi:hypothetical protein
MVIKIVNKKLHTSVFKRINTYYDRAKRAYKKGDMKMGEKWEKMSDKIYKDNYTKMFNVKKTKRGYILVK